MIYLTVDMSDQVGELIDSWDEGWEKVLGKTVETECEKRRREGREGRTGKEEHDEEREEGERKSRKKVFCSQHKGICRKPPCQKKFKKNQRFHRTRTAIASTPGRAI